MRQYATYDSSNLKHCLYGLDADLIMLGLVSREKHFTLLREKLIGNKKPIGRSLKNSSSGKTGPASDEFHLLEVSLLRDMLFLEFKPRENFIYSYDLERIVDDFAFMCMLIGNDFYVFQLKNIFFFQQQIIIPEHFRSCRKIFSSNFMEY